jgi:hypothetical protein
MSQESLKTGVNKLMSKASVYTEKAKLSVEDWNFFFENTVCAG